MGEGLCWTDVRGVGVLCLEQCSPKTSWVRGGVPSTRWGARRPMHERHDAFGSLKFEVRLLLLHGSGRA